MVSIASAVQLVIWIGPWIIPRAVAFYRSIRTPQRSDFISPVPPRVQYTLNCLYAVVILTLLGTLPYFTPSNIFRETDSRLQVPNTVLFNRLHSVRQGYLTPLDIALRSRYASASAEWALLYSAYGPDILAYCPFCKTDDPNTYLTYAIPSVLATHLIHLFLLGMMTSTCVSGTEGARWRVSATITAVSVAALEITLILQNDWKQNTTKQMLSHVDFFFWRLRTIRLLAIALADALLGWALWLTSTKRWLVSPPSLTEQLSNHNIQLQILHLKLQTLGQLQNAVVRDDQLRNIGYQYWTREPRLMDQIEQQKDVIDARRLALSRIDYDQISRNADHWIEKVRQVLRPSRHVTKGHKHE